MGSGNERRRYMVTPHPIGWAYTQNGPGKLCIFAQISGYDELCNISLIVHMLDTLLLFLYLSTISIYYQ